MPDLRERFERLRPSTGGFNLSTIVRWGNVIIGVLLLAAGIYSIVTFFTNPGRNALRFVSFIYICVMGVLLAMAELNFPPCTLQYFAFLSSRFSRSFSQIFVGVLCLSIGFDGDSGSPESILLIVAGIGTLVLAILGFCYGTDHGVVSGDAERMTSSPPREGGTSLFRRKNEATVGPDIAI